MWVGVYFKKSFIGQHQTNELYSLIQREKGITYMNLFTKSKSQKVFEKFLMIASIMIVFLFLWLLLKDIGVFSHILKGGIQ